MAGAKLQFEKTKQTTRDTANFPIRRARRGRVSSGGLGEEVVIIHRDRRAVPLGAAVFEVADHFAFPVVDANDRKTLALEASPERADVLKLLVTPGAGVGGNLLVVDAQGEIHLIEQMRSRIGSLLQVRAGYDLERNSAGLMQLMKRILHFHVQDGANSSAKYPRGERRMNSSAVASRVPNRENQTCACDRSPAIVKAGDFAQD